MSDEASVVSPIGIGSHTRRVFLVGPSGSGKTVIAGRAAKDSGWRLYDTDAEILAKTGASRISDIFDEQGEAFFRGLERECMAAVLRESERLIVATGGGLPAIPGMIDEINRSGVSVYLKASVATLWKRLNVDPRQLEDRPLLRDGGEATLDELLRARDSVYGQAAVTLDTDQLSVDEACALVTAQLRSMEPDLMRAAGLVPAHNHRVVES